MTILHPTNSAVLCFVLLVLPGATHGQQLDRYGGFLDVKGKQTGFFHTETKASHRRIMEQRHDLLKKGTDK